MSNTLDLFPSGFATGMGSPVVFSADSAKTFHRAAFNQSVNRSFDSFVVYANGTAAPWAHDFGTYHECIPGQYLNGANSTSTSVTSQPTVTYTFVDGQLTEKPGGPQVTFAGLPEPFCPPPKDDPAFVGMTPYGGGQLVLADGTHLVSMGYGACAPGKPKNGGIHLFSSRDGYHFQFLSHMARQSDSKAFAAPHEGPNEHTLALLPNGEILCVFRTGAGDATGHYYPYYSTRSRDSGKTWDTAVPMKDESGNGIGCARPHMVQLPGNITLLAGGRMMMGHDYSRAFSVWASADGGYTWKRSDGSYHHNAGATQTGAQLWPSSCNRTGWRFEFTSGYIGLVRAGDSSAAVLYDLMLPAPRPPPAPPPPPGVCPQIQIHHTLGCYNYSSWSSSSSGTLAPVLPSHQPAIEPGKVDLESCAAACYAAKLTTAGIDNGRDCFCGRAADLDGTDAKALSRPKAECEAVPCEGKPTETECGGAERMLAYAFSCGKAKLPRLMEEKEFHNPSTSYSMLIDVTLG